MLVEFNGITKGVTSGAGTANPSGAHEFTARVHVVQSVVFCVVFCRSFFVFFILAIALSVLQLTVSHYPFSIYKLFF